jgi:hypothetical protein
MSLIKNLFGLSMFVHLAVVSLASAGLQPVPPSSDDGILVGHISHVEGLLQRYVAEDGDWVATVTDAPFGLDDALYSDENSKAEFIIPNDTLLRTGGSTQLQVIVLRRDVTEVDMASGIARFFNKNEGGVIKVTTEFGYVLASRGTVFDLYVGEESVEVVALKGRVIFIHAGNSGRYEVISGSSLVADSGKVSSAEAAVDVEWDDWNEGRDRLWAKRLRGLGDSGKYLPAALRGEAYALEENGRWVEVRYEGALRRFWRPSIAADWTPFTAGRWTDYHGDNTWIPNEQFGYLTHHYGNWIYIDDFWYWAPPQVNARVGAGPFLAIGFGWYPGRVGWIHSEVEIGWVPLAWDEPYYAHRQWGGRTTVINSGSIDTITINIDGYRNLDRAVVINRDKFYKTNNYKALPRVEGSRKTFGSGYRAAPVVNDRVIEGFKNIKERHNFVDGPLARKPHELVHTRIVNNEKLSQQARVMSAATLQQNLHRSKPGKFDRAGGIVPPKVTNKMVLPEERVKPRAEITFQEKTLKQSTRQIRPQPVVEKRKSVGHEEKRAMVQQEKPGKPEKSARPEKREQSGGSEQKKHAEDGQKEERPEKENHGRK